MTQEEIRLSESGARKKHWKRWGPYLSERAWGTVREDYSPYGNAWEYLSHDHARSHAYRWNEDGLAGISDRRQMICSVGTKLRNSPSLAVALNWGIGSSFLKALVKAFDKLHIVLAANSGCSGASITDGRRPEGASVRRASLRQRQSKRSAWP